MNEYKRFILNNIICYIAKEYKAQHNEHITSMKLYKLLALYDFQHLREVGVPALDIGDYYALQNGPVPSSLYDEIKVNNGTNQYKVISGYKDSKLIENIGEPDMDYISKSQQKIIDNWLFLLQKKATESYIEVAHEEIKAWSKAWKNRGAAVKRAQMKYIDEFEKDVPENYYAYLETR
ncbi:MAG: Panacea domain-containing protein [Hydrotalea sp.]|nr:Panacea domain-containing protein [Hydrotalea sp.]